MSYLGLLDSYGTYIAQLIITYNEDACGVWRFISFLLLNSSVAIHP